MRHYRCLGRIMTLLVVWSAVGSGWGQKPYQDLTYPDLSEIRMPEIERVTLDNGMQLFLVEDHELPLISIFGRVRVGSIYEPADKIGLASITGTVMRTGGTTRQTGDEIDEQLEQIAASVETSIGEDSGFVSMSALKDDVDKGLSILADVLMNPAFPEDKLELAKIRHRSSIARRNDSARAIANREFAKLVHGQDSVYARHPEYETIDRITRADLVSFHERFFHPNNVMLAVWGDFETPEMIRKIEQAFKEWKRQKIDFPRVEEVSYEYRRSVNLIRKEDVNQTTVMLGHIGGRLDDPDYFALVLMNRILGTGFTSRLFREVRSRLGLAYSVFGHYTAEFDHPGVFYVGCQTRSETTVQAIRAMIEQVKKITREPVSEEELKIARESYLNSFVFNFDSRREIVNRMLTYAYHGYPLDFLERARERIERVSKSEILRAAREHIDPEKVHILVVGRAEDFDEPLSALGPVKEIDITIPERR